MTIWKLPETQKQLKPNTLDSRFRGNDEILGFCFYGNDGRRWTMPSETPSFPLLSATLRHSRENGNLEPPNFQITFEYCCYPTVWIPACAGITVWKLPETPKKKRNRTHWIPACAGMTIWKLPETQKKTKPNTLDSRFRRNDGGGKMPSETRNGFRRHFCLNIQTAGGLPITQSFPPQNADCGENQDFDNAHNEARLPPFAHIDVV